MDPESDIAYIDKRLSEGERNNRRRIPAQAVFRLPNDLARIESQAMQYALGA